MKKWVVLFLMVMLVILAACSSNEKPADDTENNTSEETESGSEDTESETEDETETEEQPGQEDSEEPADDIAEEESNTSKETDVSTESEENSTDETADNEKNATESDNTENESTDETNGSSVNEVNYTAAENCIMTQLTECNNVPEAEQFQAYSDLVADGTLPQAPGSGCLPCAVKYSFEVKYGESNPVNPAILPRSDKMPGEITNPSEFVQQYLFSLPAFFNNQNEVALSFYLTDSPGYNALFANKASGNYSNHMTYSVFIDSEVENLDGSMYVYTTREYSHINTDSVYEVYARYQVVEQDGRLYLTDYAELENTRVE